MSALPEQFETDRHFKMHASHGHMREAAGELAERGTWAEFGVNVGWSTRQLLAKLPSGGTFHLFDSLQGIPEAWQLTDRHTEPRGKWSSHGKWPGFTFKDSRIVHHEGWFSETLPFDFGGPLGLVHIDSDLYSSCKTVLTAIDTYLINGTVMIFDELVDWNGNYTRWQEGEWRALQESGLDIEWRGRALNAMMGVVRNRRLGPKPTRK